MSVFDGDGFRRTAVALAAVTATLAVLDQPVEASSTITVTLTAGTLSITEPTSTSLGSVTASVNGATVSGHLGTTTVTDSRASTAGWTVSISASALSDGAGHSVAANKLKSYIAVGDGPTAGVGSFAVPSTLYSTSATALTLSTSAQSFVTATTTGNNVVTFNPTIVVTFDNSAIAGTYTGTITQTVA